MFGVKTDDEILWKSLRAVKYWIQCYYLVIMPNKLLTISKNDTFKGWDLEIFFQNFTLFQLYTVFYVRKINLIRFIEIYIQKDHNLRTYVHIIYLTVGVENDILDEYWNSKLNLMYPTLHVRQWWRVSTQKIQIFRRHKTSGDMTFVHLSHGWNTVVFVKNNSSQLNLLLHIFRCNWEK